MSNDGTLGRRVPVIKILYTFLLKQLLEEFFLRKEISDLLESYNNFILCKVAPRLFTEKHSMPPGDA